MWAVYGYYVPWPSDLLRCLSCSSRPREPLSWSHVCGRLGRWSQCRSRPAGGAPPLFRVHSSRAALIMLPWRRGRRGRHRRRLLGPGNRELGKKNKVTDRRPRLPSRRPLPSTPPSMPACAIAISQSHTIACGSLGCGSSVADLPLLPCPIPLIESFFTTHAHVARRSHVIRIFFSMHFSAKSALPCRSQYHDTPQ